MTEKINLCADMEVIWRPDLAIHVEVALRALSQQRRRDSELGPQIERLSRPTVFEECYFEVVNQGEVTAAIAQGVRLGGDEYNLIVRALEKQRDEFAEPGYGSKADTLPSSAMRYSDALLSIQGAVSREVSVGE